MKSAASSLKLSQVDAFFVAHQEQHGVLMQLGVEAEFRGSLPAGVIDRTVKYLLERWPQLGRTVEQGQFGLRWGRSCRPEELLEIGTCHTELTAWRNKPIDPFRQPPLQILWIAQGEKTILACRLHHAVADAESLTLVCISALRYIASLCGDQNLPPPEPAGQLRLTDLIPKRQVLRDNRLASMWAYSRWLAREAKANRSARIRVQSCQPGDIDICERRLDRRQLGEMRQFATRANALSLLVCAAAWSKAVHAWNLRHGDGANSLVSLEFPVSLRRGRPAREAIGNYISPLVLLADAALPLAEIAGSLDRQLVGHINRRAHWSVPFFTSPARFLPWGLFRRLAARAGASGFATTHFTWLEPPPDIRRELCERSQGTFELVGLQVFTPVCLQMGAAVACVAWPDHLQLFLTYRTTALSRSDAETLADLLLAEIVNIAPGPE